MSSTRSSATLIAGPTASGKSALALEIAAKRGGVIINADAMQVYRELRVLTARPSVDEEASAPHRLYGHVPAATAYSVSLWLDDVTTALADAQQHGQHPIIVGGTGLYFRALLEGLSPIPPIPPEVRETWRRRARDAPGALFDDLRARDPVMAERLSPGDLQRVTRALEVVDATGVSLAEWQAQPGTPLLETSACDRLVVARSRDDLHRRCDQRFDVMMRSGALDEVAALLTLGLPDDRPSLRALGVRSLRAHLEGRLDLDVAVEMAKAETRQYVKRQETWARKYMADWRRVAQ